MGSGHSQLFVCLQATKNAALECGVWRVVCGVVCGVECISTEITFSLAPYIVVVCLPSVLELFRNSFLKEF